MDFNPFAFRQAIYEAGLTTTYVEVEEKGENKELLHGWGMLKILVLFFDMCHVIGYCDYNLLQLATTLSVFIALKLIKL